MKFCANCNNKLYTSLHNEDSNKLVYYCRNCNYTEDNIGEEGIIVLNTQLKKGEQRFNHIINRYTKLDPTLPRIYNMRCPNTACNTNVEQTERVEIIYMRYDEEHMKYLYLCSSCEHIWKTDDRR